MTTNEIKEEIQRLKAARSETKDLCESCAISDMIRDLEEQLPAVEPKSYDPICDDDEGCLMCGA